MEHRLTKRLDHVREAIRLKPYSRRTEASSVTWIPRAMLAHNTRHPNGMASIAIETFLTHLAVQQKVAASTHHQALSALFFLYRDVLNTPFDLPIDTIRDKKPKHVPTVLTKEEVLTVIERLSDRSGSSGNDSMAVACE
jgi:site-specific recombinase XerD